MAPFGLKLWENAFQMIPDILFLDAKNIENQRVFAKLRTDVYPPRMAQLGLKLWGNAFQMIPDISFFDVEKNISAKLFDKHFRQNFFLSEMCFSMSKSEMSGII